MLTLSRESRLTPTLAEGWERVIGLGYAAHRAVFLMHLSNRKCFEAKL